jgi:ATP-dependent DNA helicase RecG
MNRPWTVRLSPSRYRYFCIDAAASAGKQALLFAPTELLATQHYKNLERLADELPLGGARPRMGILTGSNTASEKRKIKADIAQGKLNIIISTQAALYVDAWEKLALVVVDEQHK